MSKTWLHFSAGQYTGKWSRLLKCISVHSSLVIYLRLLTVATVSTKNESEDAPTFTGSSLQLSSKPTIQTPARLTGSWLHYRLAGLVNPHLAPHEGQCGGQRDIALTPSF